MADHGRPWPAGAGHGRPWSAEHSAGVKAVVVRAEPKVKAKAKAKGKARGKAKAAARAEIGHIYHDREFDKSGFVFDKMKDKRF